MGGPAEVRSGEIDSVARHGGGDKAQRPTDGVRLKLRMNFRAAEHRDALRDAGMKCTQPGEQVADVEERGERELHWRDFFRRGRSLGVPANPSGGVRA